MLSRVACLQPYFPRRVPTCVRGWNKFSRYSFRLSLSSPSPSLCFYLLTFVTFIRTLIFINVHDECDFEAILSHTRASDFELFASQGEYGKSLMSQSSVHYLCEYYYIHGLFSEDGDGGRERRERGRERERRARCERGTEIQSARNHVTGFPFATIETLRGRSIRGSSYLFDPCSRIFLLSKYLYHFFSCYLRTRSRLLRLFSESCVQSRVIDFIR